MDLLYTVRAMLEHGTGNQIGIERVAAKEQNTPDTSALELDS